MYNYSCEIVCADLTFLQALLTCMSSEEGQTQLNTKPVTNKQTLVLTHGDVFTIADRMFRWEYPDDSPYLSKKSPKKTPSKVLAVNNSGNAAASPKAKASPKKTPKGAKSPAKGKLKMNYI